MLHRLDIHPIAIRQLSNIKRTSMHNGAIEYEYLKQRILRLNNSDPTKLNGVAFSRRLGLFMVRRKSYVIYFRIIRDGSKEVKVVKDDGSTYVAEVIWCGYAGRNTHRNVLRIRRLIAEKESIEHVKYGDVF